MARPTKPKLYRDVIDGLVEMCQHGQGQIGSKRVQKGVWNSAAKSDFLPEQHIINRLLARMTASERKALGRLLSEEVKTGVFETLKVLEEHGVAPFESGYEGSPYHDFIGRFEGWKWPRR